MFNSTEAWLCYGSDMLVHKDVFSNSLDNWQPFLHQQLISIMLHTETLTDVWWLLIDEGGTRMQKTASADDTLLDWHCPYILDHCEFIGELKRTISHHWKKSHFTLLELSSCRSIVKNDFWISRGTVISYGRWDGQI